MAVASKSGFSSRTRSARREGVRQKQPPKGGRRGRRRSPTGGVGAREESGMMPRGRKVPPTRDSALHHTRAGPTAVEANRPRPTRTTQNRTRRRRDKAPRRHETTNGAGAGTRTDRARTSKSRRRRYPRHPAHLTTVVVVAEKIARTRVAAQQRRPREQRQVAQGRKQGGKKKKNLNRLVLLRPRRTSNRLRPPVAAEPGRSRP